MKNKAAQELGSEGGKSTSPAKKDAARKNGSKGGRPKKKGYLIDRFCSECAEIAEEFCRFDEWPVCVHSK